MTPKEKANNLIDVMLGCNPNRQDGISMIDTIQAKQCAKKAIDEIIEQLTELECGISYWQEVKQEIEKI